MDAQQGPNDLRATLVTDFDGTLTRHDFFRVALERLVPPGVPDYWQEYRAGRLTHFEAMRGYYASIRASEAEVLAAVAGLGLEPDLAAWVGRLKRAGWEVLVTSAGCAWYIRRLFAGHGVVLPLYANPGRFVEGEGLLIELPPRDAPFFSPTHGVDKAAVVRAGLRAGRRVAFAGDGYPDLPAARLVEPGLRFARAALADALSQEGLPFRRFDRWAEVAEALVKGA